MILMRWLSNVDLEMRVNEFESRLGKDTSGAVKGCGGVKGLMTPPSH